MVSSDSCVTGKGLQGVCSHAFNESTCDPVASQQIHQVLICANVLWLLKWKQLGEVKGVSCAVLIAHSAACGRQILLLPLLMGKPGTKDVGSRETARLSTAHLLKGQRLVGSTDSRESVNHASEVSMKIWTKGLGSFSTAERTEEEGLGVTWLHHVPSSPPKTTTQTLTYAHSFTLRPTMEYSYHETWTSLNSYRTL